MASSFSFNTAVNIHLDYNLHSTAERGCNVFRGVCLSVCVSVCQQFNISNSRFSNMKGLPKSWISLNMATQGQVNSEIIINVLQFHMFHFCHAGCAILL